jgi:hypothetical protein
MLRCGRPEDLYITLRMDPVSGREGAEPQGPPLPSMLKEQPSYINLRVLIPLFPLPELLSVLKGIFALLLRPLLHPLFETLNTFLCDLFLNNRLCQINSIDNRKAAPVPPIGLNPCAESPT